MDTMNIVTALRREKQWDTTALNFPRRKLHEMDFSQIKSIVQT